MRVLFAIITMLSLVGCFPDCSSLTPEGNLNGRINSNSGHCDYNHADLIVNSGGGNITDAINMSNYIMDVGGTVTVDGRCSSACVLLLSAASHRAMCHGSYIGLHQGDSEKATRRMLDYLAQDDRINQYMVEYIINITPYTKIYRLDAYSSLSYGLVDEIVTCE